MKTSVDIVRDNMWLTVLVATVGPGLITALIQYVLPGEEIGIIAILVALIGGGGAAVILLSLRVRDLDEALGLSRSPELLSSPDEKPEVDEAEFMPPYHLDHKRPWSPRRTQELVDRVRGLTDVARQEAVKDDIGRWLRIRGTILNVRDAGYDRTVSATIELTNRVNVIAAAEIDPWKSILHASKIGDEIEVIGPITDIGSFGSEGFISIRVDQLLPPKSHN